MRFVLNGSITHYGGCSPRAVKLIPVRQFMNCEKIPFSFFFSPPKMLFKQSCIRSNMFKCTYSQLDKAALLAEVINHVKFLKSTATEHARGYTIPSDADEVTVRCEPQTENATNTSFLIRASICCDDSPELYTELKQSLQNLHARVISAEISSLSGRVKIVFFIMHERGGGNDDDEVAKNIFVDSMQHALRSALERVNSSVEFMPRAFLMNKRRKVLHFESSSSSS